MKVSSTMITAVSSTEAQTPAHARPKARASALRALAEALANASNYDEIVAAVMTEAAKWLAVEQVYFAEWSADLPSPSKLGSAVSLTSDYTHSHLSHTRLRTFPEALTEAANQDAVDEWLTAAIRTQEPLLVSTAHWGGSSNQVACADDLWAVCPLVAGERPIGGLFVKIAPAEKVRPRHKMILWWIAAVTSPAVLRIQALEASAEEIRKSRQAQSVASIQSKVLEMIATGEPLHKALHAITRLIEAQDDNVLCSILLVDSTGRHLTSAATSRLPAEYNAAIEGLPIGPDIGSCGTAAHLKKMVVTEDIATDPKWKDYRDIALKHGLRACWSLPILSRHGAVLGTFGMYSQQANSVPTGYHLELTHIAEHLASIAIERQLLEDEQEASRREAIERANRDPLTDLLNHRAFRIALEKASASNEWPGNGIALIDIDNFKFFNDYYGHAVGDTVLRSVAARLREACCPEDIVARYGGDEFAVLFQNPHEETAADIEARLHRGLSGMTYQTDDPAICVPITVTLGIAFVHDGTDHRSIIERAEQRLSWSQTGGTSAEHAQGVRAIIQRHVAGFSMLDALVTAVDNKDRYTRHHSDDVMEYSLMIARELGMDTATQHTIAVAALLHDVGKIGVPDYILRKPAALTPEEFDAIKQHAQMGAVIVGAVPRLEDTLDAVQHHHERWDGTGYPFGLKGEDIPLPARLMAVADAFSAMTTDRPYRQGMSRDKALLILQNGAGTQWDPDCVAAFLRAFERLS